MMLEQKYADVLESLGWWVASGSDENGMIEIESTSPAGEDLVFTLDTSDIAADAQALYENFDPEEHAVNCYGTRGAPGLLTLAQDALEIQKILEELMIKLTQVK